MLLPIIPQISCL